MRVSEIIEKKLIEALSPTKLDVIDESHKHAGHAGANPEGESHFNVKIVSGIFEGKSRLERQRMVFQAISEEMSGPVHALSLQTIAPSEEKKS